MTANGYTLSELLGKHFPRAGSGDDILYPGVVKVRLRVISIIKLDIDAGTPQNGERSS